MEYTKRRNVNRGYMKLEDGLEKAYNYPNFFSLLVITTDTTRSFSF